MYNKLPALGIRFWIMKIAATTLGESAGDLFSMTFKIGYAITSLILLLCFCSFLYIQLKSPNYKVFLYWTVILLTSTAGTTMSDFIDRTLQLGYAVGSILLLFLLFSILFIWWINEKSISVTYINSPTGEFYYWLAILVSNTLGTALGDYISESSGLGFGGSMMIIGLLLTLLWGLNSWTSLSKVFLFWFAFILTRPFGATLGDFLTKSSEQGGLNFGTIVTSSILLVILIVFAVFERYDSNKVVMSIE
ncbi:MAG: hypothetical protein IPK94_05170 [Saprospiraceae bacterium]|jgi:uncharacterized membrane-anchored protein|nr:hypothetical protein [Saprospiraceae bacterium]